MFSLAILGVFLSGLRQGILRSVGMG